VRRWRHQPCRKVRRSLSEKAGKISAFVGCWALLLQVLIPLGHVPVGQPILSDVHGWTPNTICHAQAAPVRGEHDTDKSAPIRASQICPVCLGLHLSSTFLQPSTETVAAATSICTVEFVNSEYVGSLASYRTTAQARAPPSIA
jgi:hypothetical protein